MADTVDLSEITEFHDTPAELANKLSALAGLIQTAQYMTVFTGAGISTSAKIPDFRGPQGVWTRQAQGRAPPKMGTTFDQAIPTECHMFLKALVDSGKLKYIVSQNVDGLHRKSGIPRDQISELHGNCFLEVCWNCGADYEHTNEVHSKGSNNKSCNHGCKERVPHFCHCTNNKCTNCKAVLKDSIIHFGENLPQKALARAWEEAAKSDLCIVLGSSLRVSPACDIPKETKKIGGKLVIVNFQSTPLDKIADMKVHAATDEVCNRLRAMLSCTAAPVATDVSPVASTSLKIAFGNKHETVSNGDDNCHHWEMFVEPSTDEPSSKTIELVRYILHPTFTPNIIDIEKAPFVLDRLGWGTFTVGIDVVVKDTITGDEAVHHFNHQLKFDNGRTVTTAVV